MTTAWPVGDKFMNSGLKSCVMMGRFCEALSAGNIEEAKAEKLYRNIDSNDIWQYENFYAVSQACKGAFKSVDCAVWFADEFMFGDTYPDRIDDNYCYKMFVPLCYTTQPSCFPTPPWKTEHCRWQQYIESPMFEHPIRTAFELWNKKKDFNEASRILSSFYGYFLNRRSPYLRKIYSTIFQLEDTIDGSEFSTLFVNKFVLPERSTYRIGCAINALIDARVHINELKKSRVPYYPSDVAPFRRILDFVGGVFALSEPTTKWTAQMLDDEMRYLMLKDHLTKEPTVNMRQLFIDCFDIGLYAYAQCIVERFTSVDFQRDSEVVKRISILQISTFAEKNMTKLQPVFW